MSGMPRCWLRYGARPILLNENTGSWNQKQVQNREEPSRAEPGAAAGDNPAAHLARPLQVLETLWQTSKWWISGGNRDYPLTQKVKITVGGTTREFN